MDGIYTLYGFAAQGKYLCLSCLLSVDVVTHFLIAHGVSEEGEKAENLQSPPQRRSFLLIFKHLQKAACMSRRTLKHKTSAAHSQACLPAEWLEPNHKSGAFIARWPLTEVRVLR